MLLLLMLVTSLAEIVSIGAILPFLAVLTVPVRIFNHPVAQPLIHFFDITKPEQLLAPLTLAFAVAALLAGGMRMLLVWASTRLAFATGADLSFNIYRRTLFQPYSVHIARNSSEVINGIITKVSAVMYNIIAQSLILISSLVMLVAILFILLFLEPTVTLAAMAGFGVIYVIIIQFTRKQKLQNGQRISRESTEVLKALQEGLGGIRDVLLNGSQGVYCDTYRAADLPLRRAQGNNQFLAQSPRFAIEALGMALIAGLAYVLGQRPDGLAKAIPILGVLAIGAQRMLPLMQNAYVAWSSMQGAQPVFNDTLDLLDQPLPEYAEHPAPMPLPFQNQIRLNHLSFKYNSQTPWVLKNLDLVITKGSRVGFIGATGSGKSTLLDIVMALLTPTNGSVEVDDQAITPKNHRAWQACIAHVPQAIYLTDSTIEENIAFGVPKNQIDQERVRLAARQAQIADAIETWPEQYQTIVGERGVRLSGGQRQRIGIARALYKQASVIVFDEATSALDNETEQAVMQAIESLSSDLTILIIAHRLTTLQNCTQIVEIADGGVGRIGSYKEIVAEAA